MIIIIIPKQQTKSTHFEEHYSIPMAFKVNCKLLKKGFRRRKENRDKMSNTIRYTCKFAFNFSNTVRQSIIRVRNTMPILIKLIRIAV